MAATSSIERPEPRVFGLTGGYGSGKSSVAARLRGRGLPIIDADELARAVVLPGSDGLKAIVAEFGRIVLDGAVLDRKALARIVFNDPAARQRLNALTHPRVQALKQERKLALAAAGEPLVCYEVPLLFENGLEVELRPVVVVGTHEALQVERAMQRDHHTEAEVRARLAAQLPLADKLARADYVIDNSGTREATQAQTDQVLRSICERLGVDAGRYFGTSALKAPPASGR